MLGGHHHELRSREPDILFGQGGLLIEENFFKYSYKNIRVYAFSQYLFLVI